MTRLQPAHLHVHCSFICRRLDRSKNRQPGAHASADGQRELLQGSAVNHSREDLEACGSGGFSQQRTQACEERMTNVLSISMCTHQYLAFVHGVEVALEREDAFMCAAVAEAAELVELIEQGVAAAGDAGRPHGGE